MNSRCHNPHHRAYGSYGGRGITVVAHWRSYENFLEDMGRRPASGYSLERRNNEAEYSKENCVWATRIEQQNNTRANVRLVYKSRSLTVAQWATEKKMSTATIRARLRRGWPVDAVLSAPLQRGSRTFSRNRPR